MRGPFGNLLVLATLVGSSPYALASGLRVFASGVPAVAGDGAVTGLVYYKVSTRERSGSVDEPSSVGKVGGCLLQHGYVVSQATLDGLADERHGEEKFDAFARDYFSTAFVEALLAGPCERVFVAMQEAILTSTLEMTRRTEVFMRDVVCGSGSCAVFGHSKGGAVATSMARRCMEETSEMGAAGCDHTRKFYSASGNNLGASYGAIIYGLYLDDPDGMQLKVIEALAKVFHIDIEVTDPEVMTYVPGETNPMWVDISSVAPMEGGVPIMIKNDVRLEHRGWLTGDYAAANTGHNFDTDSSPLFGCGPKRNVHTYKACVLSGATIPYLHKDKLRPAFERGVSAWRSDPRFVDPVSGTHAYLDSLSWANHQIGDGMADFALSMDPCFNGGSAVASCATFSKSNHTATAGAGPEVQTDVTRFFSATDRP